jgi:hypothetical protein
MQHNFSQRKFGNSMRRFCSAWFSEFGNMLEYRIEKTSYFVFVVIFRPGIGKQSSGDTFVTKELTNWNKKNKLSLHVGGGANCARNIAWNKCEYSMKHNQHIEVLIYKQSDVVRDLYQIWLTISLDCLHYLLLQGSSVRGHSELIESNNHGNFLQVLRWYVGTILKNSPKFCF